jgi:3'-5' exoribonuclease
MWVELDAHLQEVTDPFLRVLLNRIVGDHAPQLREWPAALQVHHAYRGGLLEHVVRMIGIGRVLARAYGASEDLVTAGVVVHDIGKLQELSYSGGVTSYSREGNLVGHIGLGLILVREAAHGISGFPEDLRTHLEHLVLSHHGSKERGSPVEPKTLEAFILSAVDELDSRINQVERAVREDPGSEEFTAWHRRLGRVLYKGS